jgi:hypothetical protein
MNPLHRSLEPRNPVRRGPGLRAVKDQRTLGKTLPTNQTSWASLTRVKRVGATGAPTVRPCSLAPDNPHMHRPPPGRQSQCEGLTNEEAEPFPMADQKPNAALRPNPGVRRTTTHSGVTHVRAYHSGRYTVVGNHLAQHRELSLTAIGLALHILSLPEGAPVDIRSLAERFPEGRDRIAFALRELEACGYLERVKERTEAGRLITRTYAHHAPGHSTVNFAPGRETPQEDDRALNQATPSHAHAVPTLTNPPAPLKPAAPPDRPEASQPAVPTDPSATHAPHHDRAVALLAGLRRTDDRLTLSRRDVNRLAPAVTAWLDGGATAAVIHRTVTVGLPPDLRCPAGLVAHRLRELLPPPLPARPTPSPAGGMPHTRTDRPHPFQTCDGCERAFRAPQPGRCRDCRSRLPSGTGSLRAA